MSDQLIELSKRHYDHQSKYDYWLMTLAAAAIAFVVSDTRNDIWSLWYIPLVIAVAFWVMSIVVGCLRQSELDIVFQAEYNRVSVMLGYDKRSEGNPALQQAMSDKLYEDGLKHN